MQPAPLAGAPSLPRPRGRRFTVLSKERRLLAVPAGSGSLIGHEGPLGGGQSRYRNHLTPHARPRLARCQEGGAREAAGNHRL